MYSEFFWLQKCLYHSYNSDKIWGYWNKIPRAGRKKYMCENQKTTSFEVYNTKLQDIDDFHLAIAPWIYGSIPVINVTFPGTKPKKYDVLKSDDQLHQLLLNCYQRR